MKMAYAMLSLIGVVTCSRDVRACEALEPAEGALGYRQRAARCEGLYVRDTASTVRLKAIVAGPQPETGTTISLTPIGTPPAGPYSLRVTSVGPFEHYQLDAKVQWPGSFSWPTEEVLRPSGVQLSHLAPLAWSSSDGDPLYIPVRFGTGVAQPKTIRVVVESSTPFEACSARIVRKGAANAVSLRPANAPSTTTQAFVIPEGGPSGTAVLWLRWRLRGASDTESESWQIWLP